LSLPLAYVRDDQDGYTKISDGENLKRTTATFTQLEFLLELIGPDNLTLFIDILPGAV
jgi:hypothetical protein